MLLINELIRSRKNKVLLLNLWCRINVSTYPFSGPLLLWQRIMNKLLLLITVLAILTCSRIRMSKAILVAAVVCDSRTC